MILLGLTNILKLNIVNQFRMLMVKNWSQYGGFKFDVYRESGGIDYYISKIVNDEIIEYDMLVNLN